LGQVVCNCWGVLYVVHLFNVKNKNLRKNKKTLQKSKISLIRKIKNLNKISTKEGIVRD